MNGNTIENQTLSLSALLLLAHVGGVLEVGEEMEKMGADTLTNGGFYVMEIKRENFEDAPEYYSQKFRTTLGFTGEDDFPSLTSSWMKYIDEKDKMIAFENLKKALGETEAQHPYFQLVNYTTKTGGRLKVICSGLVVKKGDGEYLIGTHKIV